jgi:hypothetical protein
MRLGFTVWPTNQASLSRRPHHLHAQKKARHFHWNATGTLPPGIYSIVHYEFDKEKVSTNITSLTPYCICDETCTGNHMRSGIQGTGFSTVTTHPHTLLWLCVQFSLKTKQPSCHTSLLTRISALWQHNRTLFFDCVQFSPKTKQPSCHTSLFTRVSAIWPHNHTLFFDCTCNFRLKQNNRHVTHPCSPELVLYDNTTTHSSLTVRAIFA